METSDRGLLDVERFDLEPDRPLLHGLIGDTRAEELRGLPTADKVPFVLDILGYETISPRFAASLFEIDRTVRTWPQLASGVALGGALATDAARRLALGKLQESGRFYVDLEELVAAGRSTSPKRSPPLPDAETPTPVVSIARAAPPLDESLARHLVHIATLAPSGGNVQPWRFELNGAELLVRSSTSNGGAPSFRWGRRSRTFASLPLMRGSSPASTGSPTRVIRSSLHESGSNEARRIPGSPSQRWRPV
jgi:hypothetical protein